MGRPSSMWRELGGRTRDLLFTALPPRDPIHFPFPFPISKRQQREAKGVRWREQGGRRNPLDPIPHSRETAETAEVAGMTMAEATKKAEMKKKAELAKMADGWETPKVAAVSASMSPGKRGHNARTQARNSRGQFARIAYLVDSDDSGHHVDPPKERTRQASRVGKMKAAATSTKGAKGASSSAPKKRVSVSPKPKSKVISIPPFWCYCQCRSSRFPKQCRKHHCNLK